MNGEQLCYMHGVVHRSLFIEIQNGDIPKCPYLVTIYRLTLLVATVNFHLSSSAFVFKPISSCAPSHSALEER